MIPVKDQLNFANDAEIKKLLEPDEKVVYSGKITKFNDMGWKQERNMVVTNKSIMNLQKKSLKRKMKITTVEAITKSKSKDSTEFVLHIPSEYDYRYTGDQREPIIQAIKQGYSQILSKNLPIYGVPHLFLKDFVTTKADRKKNNFKIPGDEFRLKDEDILTEGDPVSDLLEEIPDFKKTKGASLYQKNKAEKKVMIEDFKVVKVLGKGSFGRVYLVEMTSTGKTYAMKELRKDVLIDTDQIQNTRIEKEIMKNANHPFLVNLEYVFQTTGKILFVMKFMRGGELYTLLTKEKRFPEARCKFYTSQIALALAHLHNNKIIYRDLKPENILLDDDGYICLTDFGLARFLEEDKKAMSFCGTPEYIAPEIITGEGHNKSADWWSFGVLLYEMLVGVPPFYHQNQNTMYQFITSKAVIFPDPIKHKISVSEPAKDLILKLLVKTQKDRLGSGPTDAEEILKHPFFASIDLKALLEKKIKPDYIPVITDKYSVEHFDPSITGEDPTTTAIPAARMELIKKFEEEFKDFT